MAIKDTITRAVVDLFSKKKKGDYTSISDVRPTSKTNANPEAYYSYLQSRSSVITQTFNGEKNLGELGPGKFFILDYFTLRERSWQAYIENEMAFTVINRMLRWVIGSGLKLQSIPKIDVLNDEGINLNRQKFSKSVEARFDIYKNSKHSSYSGMQTLSELEYEAKKNAIIGGDVLVILRYIDGFVKVQLVDGMHIQNIPDGHDWYPILQANGNYIKNGIEVDSTGKHVAYYVRHWYPVLKYERVPAYDENGMTRAFLYIGSRYRIDNSRGIPLVAACLESMKKIERYKEATVGSAEERQKIVFSIEHDIASTGQNPFAEAAVKAYKGNVNDDLPEDINGIQLANNVVATTNKQTVNMPQGAKLKSLESKNELHFKDFYTVNYNSFCSTVNIPPDVARSLYDSNYSASRAAIQDWSHTLDVERKDTDLNFLSPIYAFFLHVEILTNKVKATGYIAAFYNKNHYVVEAYRKHTFIGVNPPHIDPFKEVQAERLKLGSLADAIPLTTIEAATDALNGGEFSENIEQFSMDLETLKKAGIQTSEPPKEDNDPKDKKKSKKKKEED